MSNARSAGSTTRDGARPRPLSLRRKLLFALLPLLFLLALGEIGARVWVSTRPAHGSHRGRLTNPAYTSKPWFSEDFLAASSRQPGGWTVPPGTHLVIPHDYADRYFQVQGGMRRTTGFRPPEGGGRTVRLFVLGGSTTYGSEVPDEWTWASQLQASLAADETTARVEVLNLGTTSVSSAQEVERLDHEIGRGNVPDVCVFLDGVNDVLQGVFNADPAGFLYEVDLRRATGFRAWLGRRSRLARLLLTPAEGSGRPPAPVDDPARLRALAEETADRYAGNLREARRLCERHGIDLFVFLQPLLYSLGRELTAHERSIRDAEPHGAAKQECFRVALPLLRSRIEALRAEGLSAFDLTGAYDANREPIFLDLCHVESTGNRILADAVLAHVRDALRRRAERTR